MKIYKLFGERNCGTNLVKYLLDQDNFYRDDLEFSEIKILNKIIYKIGAKFPKSYDFIYDHLKYKKILEILGWKHSYPDKKTIKKYNATPVLIVRHPKFWKESFLKNSFHHYGAEKYEFRKIENSPIKEIDIDELIFSKYKSYINLSNSLKCIIIQYETLIKYFEEIKLILINIFGHCQNLPEKEIRKFIKDKNTNYLKKLDSSRLEILDNLNKGLFIKYKKELNFFGYEEKNWKKLKPFIS